MSLSLPGRESIHCEFTFGENLTPTVFCPTSSPRHYRLETVFVVDIRIDVDPSPSAVRRTPTEVRTSILWGLMQDFGLTENRAFVFNDSAFGGATGADLAMEHGVEATHSTSWPSVYTLATALGPLLNRNQMFFFFFWRTATCTN